CFLRGLRVGDLTQASTGGSFGPNQARLLSVYDTESRHFLAPVKTENGPKRVPLADRLAVLLDVFSPWEGISLSYRQFAAALGGSVTEAAIKKWPHRKKFPADVARLIVTKAKELGSLTLAWSGSCGGRGAVPKREPKRSQLRNYSN